MTAEDFKAARSKLGMTQQELADMIGLTRSTLSHMERGSERIARRTELAVRFLMTSAGRQWMRSASRSGVDSDVDSEKDDK